MNSGYVVRVGVGVGKASRRETQAPNWAILLIVCKTLQALWELNYKYNYLGEIQPNFQGDFKSAFTILNS
ncbi:hypothetical protein H6H01_05040 [Nostoc calcicola FACHB-3891]|nr:hypothetical protein [Nostoc calcicola FACHB-3891]